MKPILTQVLRLVALLLATAWLAMAAQANNTFPGTTIAGAASNISASNVGANGETGEPVPPFPGGNTLNTMWYSWTAPGNGTVTFETCSATLTTFDTVLASYTGGAVNALTLITQNDDTTGCAVSVNPNYGSRITWNVTQGTVYRVQVDGYGTATGNFRLLWSFNGFTISKTASVASIAAPGTITYTIAVANVGAAALTGPVMTDVLLLGVAPRTLTSGPTLTSGDTNSNGQVDTTETWTYTATFAVPQSDIDLGGTYSNVATFDTTQTIAYASSAATTSITQSPAFTNVKAQTAGPSPITAAGQTITYTITIDNTGNVTLTSPIVVSDTFLLGGSARTLSSGPTYSSGDTDSDGAIDTTEIWLYAATYTVPQSDIDGTGSFSNVLRFDTAQTPPVNSNTVTTNVTRTASFTHVKSQFSGPNPITAAGQVITYRLTIANTGNQTLTGPTVVSDTFQLGGSARTLSSGPAYSSGDTDSDGAIDLLEVWIYTATYTVPQSDINGTGNYTNLASFDTTQTAPVVSNTVTTNVTRTRSLNIIKSWLFAVPAHDQNSNGLADEGDFITYRFDVQNNGNITLTGVVVSDVHGGSGPGPTPDDEAILTDVAPASDSTDATASNQIWSSLAPNDTVRFIGTYTVTQTDFDNQ